MKFYFCETCGKRITEHDFEEGLARNKKLKGVYCQDCAVGVMTIEFDAIKDVQLRPATPQKGQPVQKPSAGSRGSAINIAAAQRSTPKSPPTASGKVTTQRNSPLLLIGAGLATAAIVAVVVAVSTGSRKTERVAVAPALPAKPSPVQTVQPVAPQPAPKETPPPTETRTPADAATAAAPIAPVPDSEALARQDFDKVLAFEGIGADDVAGRVAALEAFINTHPNANVCQQARANIEALKKQTIVQAPAPTPVPSVETTPVTPPKPSAKTDLDEGAQKAFANVLTEVVPLLRQNQLGPATKLLDERLRDTATPDVTEKLKTLRADVADVRSLRQRALDALRGKAGGSVTLKLRTGVVTGTVKDQPGRNDLTVALRDGPELTVSAEQLDAPDVDTSAPVSPSDSSDLRVRGLLFLFCGDAEKASTWFAKARDAGVANVPPAYASQITVLKDVEKSPATGSVKPKPPPRPHSATMMVLSTLQVVADDVTIRDSYAYCCATAENKIQIIDISDPKNMALLPAVQSSFPSPHVSRAQGKFLYVSESGEGGKLEIFDLSKAPDMVSAGSVALSSSTPVTMDVNGSYVYVLQKYGDEFGVYDVSKPAAPVHKATVHIEHRMTDLRVSGRFVFAAGMFGNSGYMGVFDVSNASSPVLAGATGGWQYPRGLAVQDSFAYWPSGNNKLIVVNAAKPAHLALSGHGPGLAAPHAVEAQGRLLLVVDQASGKTHLHVFDLTNPGSPKFCQTFDLGGINVKSMALQNGYLFVATGTGLVAVDLSTNPFSGGK